MRSSMAALITRVRDLISDPSGASQVFTDDRLQLILDRHRLDVRYAQLEPAPTRTPGTVAYLDYFADAGEWEDSVVLTDGTSETLTPDDQDLVIGRFSFNANQDPPVFLTGQTYDLHAAAADALEDWASKLKLEYDVSVSGDSLNRSQKVEQLTGLANTYRRRARVGVISMERTDWR